MSCIEKTIKIPGFNLALKIWNANCPNPILCLHGKMDNAASFDLLAPLFPERQIVAVDFPGTGYSSHYPDGVLPNWKNDAYLMLHLINALGWNSFDIIAHSLGSLVATTLGIAQPKQVGQIIYLDILGPTLNFIDKKIDYFHFDVETYLSFNPEKRTTFPDQKSVIQDRMLIGKISYAAAKALVKRGTIEDENGWYWTFDRRLRCVSSTLPCEDELRQMFYALDKPVSLIRANQGVPYPQDIFKSRTQCFRDLTIYEVQGGHHVHMDNPMPVANLIAQILNNEF
ncbi:lipase A [Legionella santicrucis]|uniref:Lipase A n=1 Tax=Legionella santicrucis TaxID=45074 RepID=A0A0W0YAB0_9GAMM|nr:alpha/beta hydrolase [Legionella santicrucis]KTD53851.1 lipase A [Legionella santicrucis]